MNPVLNPEIEALKKTIGAHKGHFSRLEKALGAACQFAEAFPSDNAGREVLEYLNKAKNRKHKILEGYTKMIEEFDLPKDKILDIEKKMEAAELAFVDVSQQGMKALDACNRAAVAAHAPPMGGGAAGGGGGDNVKIQSALKPDKLTRENSPVELRSWIRKFRAFYSMSKLEKASVPNQQAFLFQCIDLELETHLRQEIDDRTPIFGQDGCMDIIERRFMLSYPLFSRRLAFFRYEQAKGQSFADFYANLRRQGDEANLHNLDVDAQYVHKIISGICDEKLREKLCKLREPKLAEVLQEAEQHEVAKKAMKDIQAGRQNNITVNQAAVGINYM